MVLQNEKPVYKGGMRLHFEVVITIVYVFN